MRRDTGFTLLELIGVLAVIAILVVIAFGNVQSGRSSANEASTIGFFKKAVISHEQYRTRFGRYPPTFEDLVISGFFPNDQNPSGYGLNYYPGLDTWAFQGNPKEPSVTGDRYFYVDQVGIIRSALDGPASSKSTPIEGLDKGGKDADGKDADGN